MIKIGLLGCGNVGHIIASRPDIVSTVAVYDIVGERARELAATCGAAPCEEFEAFLNLDYNIVVEAASVQAVKKYAEKILKSGKDIVILSVGALADKEFRKSLVNTASVNGRKIYIPSGAITGLDNLKVGQITGFTKLLLKTTKSAASLGIKCREKVLIFEGTANECIKKYPKNINVAIALGLAAGSEAEVELWVDPDIDRNMHEVIAEGDFGEICIRVSNVPSPENPATSYMAALSILTLLKNIDSPLIIGT